MDISSNLAYDYKRFEETKTPQVTTVKKHGKPKQSMVLAKAICSMMVVVLMLSALLYTKVIQAELGVDYNAAQKELSRLKGENSRLQIQFGKEFSQDAIEDIARTQLKMKELDNSKIEYIEFNSMDKAEVIKKQSFFDNIVGWFMGMIG